QPFFINSPARSPNRTRAAIEEAIRRVDMRLPQKNLKIAAICVAIVCALLSAVTAVAQMVDQTRAPNAAQAGILKSFTQPIGEGRGDWMPPDSSSFIIARDPFRAVRRGRQLFQRKFTRALGQGPNFGDGTGNIGTDIAIGAGLADSCAACHGRPRGAAG